MKSPIYALRVCAAIALLAPVLPAQPNAAAVTNNYSWTLPGLPNYGIAQGSIFTLWGSNMAGAATPLLPVPLNTTVNGVTLNVIVNGVTTHPPLYFVSPTQIAAILPSATPVGTGTISVTYGGQPGASAPIKVVESTFGLLTLNNAGTGPAAAMDAGYRMLSFTNAVNPGEYVILWGSGLGPVTEDEKQFQTPRDLSVPIQVSIGGVQAQVAYHGRSQYPGLDQINVVVPQGVAGCYVSVVVQTGAANVVSNFSNIPVAASGRTCSDQTTGLTATQLTNLSNQANVSMGSVLIGKTSVTTQSITVGGITIPGTTTTTDNVSSSFVRYSASQFATVSQNTASLGSCQVYTFSASSGGGVSNPFTPAYLNAGPAINVDGPAGRTVAPLQNNFYSFATTPPATFIPAGGGNFTLSNGNGGPDVGPFSTALALAAPLVWSNQTAITTVTRSQGVTVNWTGGQTNTFVQITGGSVSGTSSDAVGGFFVCTAPVAAHSFTVPSAVLLSLPPSGSISDGGTVIPLAGSLAVANYTNPQQFTAPNVDLAWAMGYVSNSASVVYQ